MTQFVTMELPIQSKNRGGHGRTPRERVRVTSYYSPETDEKFKRLRELHPDYCKSAVIDMALKEWFEKHWDEIEPPALVFVPVVVREDGREITYMAYVEYAKELGIVPNE
jgi:hypothetical protein